MKNVKVIVKTEAEKEDAMSLLAKIDSSYKFGLIGSRDDEYIEIYASNCGEIKSAISALKFKEISMCQLRKIAEELKND